MNCDACRYENPTGAGFCEFCGHDLVAVAPSHGAAPAPNVRPTAISRTPPPPLSPPGLAAPGEDVARAHLRGVLIARGGEFDEDRLHPVRDGRVAIGRSPDCEIHLPEQGVEPLHAFLFVHQERTSWLDVSLAGSHLNGRRVHGEQVNLEHGACLRVGEARLVYLCVPEGIFEDRA